MENGVKLLESLRIKYKTFLIYRYVSYFNKQKYKQSPIENSNLKTESLLDDNWRNATFLTREVFRRFDVCCDPIPGNLEPYIGWRRYNVLVRMFQCENDYKPNDYYVQLLDEAGVWPDCRKGYLMEMPNAVSEAIEDVFWAGGDFPRYNGDTGSTGSTGGSPFDPYPNNKKGEKIGTVKGDYSNILGGMTACGIAPSALMGEHGGTFGCVRFEPKCTDCDKIVNGKKCNKFHNGLDIQADENTSVYTAYKGVVSLGEDKRGLGKYVAVQSSKEGGGYIVVMYCHLSSYSVSHGDYINSGDLIGKAGHTGNGDEFNPHVHIIVKDNSWDKDAHTDPIDYLEIK